jgi:putative DNA primase/helicase
MLDFTKIDWVNMIHQFGIPPHFLRKQHGPCPICGTAPIASGSKHHGRRRFRFDNKGNTGSWICSTCGSGTGFSLIKKFTKQSNAAILRALEIYSGAENVQSGLTQAFPRMIFRDELTPEKMEANRKMLQQTWESAKPVTSDDPVAKYLQSRIPFLNLAHLGHDIRYHPGMDYFELNAQQQWKKTGIYPVMLARVVDMEKNPITLHRTYLTADGKKAPFETIKKQMQGIRKLKGAAIRLNHVSSSRVVGITEGIETGLAVMTGYRNQINVWSLLNAGNLAIADIPRACFDQIIIFADHDAMDIAKGWRPGEHYAQLLKEKLLKEGFQVLIKIPPKVGMDFADYWQGCCTLTQLGE